MRQIATFVKLIGMLLISTAALAADTTRPSPPVNLHVGIPSLGSVELAWGEATDNVGVVGYKVYRSTTAGSGFKQIGLSASLTYSDTTAAAKVQYYYRVHAYDAAGNISFSSNEVAGALGKLALIWRQDSRWIGYEINGQTFAGTVLPVASGSSGSICRGLPKPCDKDDGSGKVACSECASEITSAAMNLFLDARGTSGLKVGTWVRSPRLSCSDPNGSGCPTNIYPTQ